MMSPKTVGILMPGDMGHVVGRVLQAHGLRALTRLKGRSARTRGLAQKAGIADVSTYEDLVRDTGMILSIVVPEEALNLSRTVAEAVRRVGKPTIYVDCNAIAPSTVKAVDEVMRATGSRCIDVGIIGSPPREPGRTRFYASGPEVELFAELSNFGLDVRTLGRDVGLASGLKMCYAALTKGTTALATDLLTTAQTMGLYQPLIEEFQRSQESRYQNMERQLPVMPTKAYRWVSEMEQIAKTFAEVGLTPRILQGAADMYRFVSTTSIGEERPENRDKSRTLAQMIASLAADLQAKKATPPLP
jgi:3-hydroxyisobutyrate dehydrogenase-like beta-hydroxyacid dehydrogenase